MTRTALFAALLVGSASLSRADVEVAPPPREVGPDGKAPPAPAPEAVPKSANPVETVERIIQNSKAIADRLAESDAGEDTRKTQDQTLALIDSLLKQDNPPPKSDKDQDKDQNPDQNPDQKKDEQDPSGGSGMKDMPPPTGGMEPKGGKQPMGGGQDRQHGERRPRSGSGQAKAGQEPKPGDGQKKAGDQGPKGTAKDNPKDPMQGGTAGEKKKDDPTGGTAGRTGGVPKGPPQGPSLPLADEVVKDVWGHLPDRERQQITQFYREQFMPRYSELIKQYFSSLAEHSRRSSGEMRR